ncbi:MAG: ATP-binding cassette domain-containing protein [Desulfarculus sp.]|nr:ATP-binding cassette domain-containing protein [Pseudomonadota bacterium]MBV1715656.1 ATP-binding cassette domain-containing protein [Desulfarculus sp.]MBU4575675.1 ATP-binding cassette domain-containing protein [Pseudomonadota bacterium]MBU4600100.1 ATP-binding cassette domain-containing protein [Pseudomonadota bacterium]MBV1738812.1 ATP-binding cassette domain-containing protein [Desulfarculus sp.]
MSQALFSLRGVVKRFEQREALNLERLDLEAGVITVVEGPNGAGKTTLLSLLALISPPDRGRLFFDGHELPRSGSQLTAWRRQITLVAQQAYLFETSVDKNVAYGLRLRGMDRATREERVAQALEQVGLAGFGPRRARRLSGGEMQRVALARALVLRPRALLLDEPFANLDPASAQVFERVLGELPGQGCAVVLVSHALEQAHRLAQRVVYLREGRLVPEDGHRPGA